MYPRYVPGCKALIFFTLITFLYYNAGAQKTWDGGAGTNNWADGNNWNPNGVPAAGDAVTIGNGFNVILNTNTTIASLTIGGGASGSLTMGNNNTNRALTVSGTVTINNGATFNTAGNGGNTINIAGNLINNGTFDMNIGSADADILFNGAVNQTLSGSGATTDFNLVTINNTGAANNNIVEVLPSNLSAATGFLTLTRGILKMSGSYTFSNTFFNAASPTINADEGIWLNNSNVTVTGQNGDTQLSGLIRISAGTYNVGVSADWWLYYNTGAVLTIEGGALNISGAFFGNTSSQTITYTQSAGVVTVNTAGNSYSVASFEIQATGSVFNLSGGTIVLQRAASTATDYINYSTSAAVTGGTLQVGNGSTPASSLFWVISTPALYNLVVNSTSTPTAEMRAVTTVLNDVTIGGVLDVSPLNVSMNIGHNWTNNGTFTRGTATVTFNGNSTQQIGGSNATTFHNFTVNKSAGGITLNNDININGTGTFTAGVVTSSLANSLTFNDNATMSGGNYGAIPSYIDGPISKVGNDAFTFPVGKPGVYAPISISAPGSVTDAFMAEYVYASGGSLGSISAAGLMRVSNCEYWNITQTAGTATVNVTLSWSGQSRCNAAVYVNDLASLTVAHFNGSNWDSHGNGGGTTGNGVAGTVTRNSLSVFGTFTLGSTNAAFNPLPVRFGDINGFVKGTGVQIDWTVYTEENVNHYDIERSANGTSFYSIGSVTALNQHAEAHYSFFDASPLPGTGYYRIKSVDNDGRFIVSSIIKINPGNNRGTTISIYPNPVKDGYLSIQAADLKRGNYIVRVISITGQQVYDQSFSHNGGPVTRIISLPSRIKPGMYVLTLETNGSKLSSNFFTRL